VDLQYIWVVLDHAPDVRYKKRLVLPGGFIPGPNPPKITDSFLFPRVHHLSAIQNEGLQIWDAHRNEKFVSNPFLMVACADVIGMASLSRLVGHHGKRGCRLYCAMPGHHKRNLPQYYPARLKPDHYMMSGCDHEDYPLPDILETANCIDRYTENLRYVELSPNKTQYQKHPMATGICKATILTGLPQKLWIPRLFSVDIMHLPAINIPELLVGLVTARSTQRGRPPVRNRLRAMIFELEKGIHGSTTSIYNESLCTTVVAVQRIAALR
jgi:hypothetical protein